MFLGGCWGGCKCKSHLHHLPRDPWSQLSAEPQGPSAEQGEVVLHSIDALRWHWQVPRKAIFNSNIYHDPVRAVPGWAKDARKIFCRHRFLTPAPYPPQIHEMWRFYHFSQEKSLRAPQNLYNLESPLILLLFFGKTHRTQSLNSQSWRVCKRVLSSIASATPLKSFISAEGLSGPISRDVAILSLRYPISRDTLLGRLGLAQNCAIPHLGTSFHTGTPVLYPILQHIAISVQYPMKTCPKKVLQYCRYCATWQVSLLDLKALDQVVWLSATNAMGLEVRKITDETR